MYRIWFIYTAIQEFCLYLGDGIFGGLESEGNEMKKKYVVFKIELDLCVVLFMLVL